MIKRNNNTNFKSIITSDARTRLLIIELLPIVRNGQLIGDLLIGFKRNLKVERINLDIKSVLCHFYFSMQRILRMNMLAKLR